ncbi:MAG: class I SAM-dependent methyltransferase [Acidobacteria bacterium]|nr:class I SAM-dependent methyltransferase [Acidobacteriota bacterium]
MRSIAIAVAITRLAAAQVADKANAGYRTVEGRTNVARTLLAEDRDVRQKPKELIAALEIRPGQAVADLGTGAGYLLPHLSRAVGAQGKVFAQDIFPDFLEKARATAASAKLANVEFVHGTERDPKLPAGSADLIFTLDAYHHFDYPEAMLAGILRALKPGGRLVIVDFYKNKESMPNGRALEHIRIDAPEVVREVEANGFKLVRRTDHIPGSQYLAVFERR